MLSEKKKEELQTGRILTSLGPSCDASQLVRRQAPADVAQDPTRHHIPWCCRFWKP